MRFARSLTVLAAGTLAPLSVAAPASADVLLNLGAHPNTGVGRQLMDNHVADAANHSGTSTATFTLDDPAATTVTVNVSYTGEGATHDNGDYPRLRALGTGLGIDSALANQEDHAAQFDEQGAVDGAVDEQVTFTFSETIALIDIGLFNFASETTGGTAYPDVLGVTINGNTTTYASNHANVAADQAVGNRTDIAVLTFDAPIILNAGDTLTLFVADNGDDMTRSTFSPYSMTVTVPEPGSMGLLSLGASLMLGRRRRR